MSRADFELTRGYARGERMSAELVRYLALRLKA
jgi:hypothetical protein